MSNPKIDLKPRSGSTRPSPSSSVVREPPRKIRKKNDGRSGNHQRCPSTIVNGISDKGKVRTAVWKWWCDVVVAADPTTSTNGGGERRYPSEMWNAVAIGFVRPECDVGRRNRPLIVDFPLERKARLNCGERGCVVFVRYEVAAKRLEIFGASRAFEFSDLSKIGAEFRVDDVAKDASLVAVADAGRKIFASPGDFFPAETRCAPIFGPEGFAASVELASAIGDCHRHRRSVSAQNDFGPSLGRCDPLGCRLLRNRRDVHLAFDPANDTEWGVDKFAAATSFMATAAAAHGGPLRRAAGLGYALLREAMSVVRLGGGTPREMLAFSLASIDSISVDEVYQYDSTQKTFFCARRKNAAVDPSTRAMLRRVLCTSEIRNRVRDSAKESMVFAVSAARGLLRMLLPCESCRRRKDRSDRVDAAPSSACVHLAIPCKDGLAFVTSSDLFETRFLESMKEFDAVVRALAFGHRGLAGLPNFLRLSKKLSDEEKGSAAPSSKRRWPEWDPAALKQNVVDVAFSNYRATIRKQQNGRRSSSESTLRNIERSATTMATLSISAARSIETATRARVDVVVGDEFTCYADAFARSMTELRTGPLATLFAVHDDPTRGGKDDGGGALVADPKPPNSLDANGRRRDYLSGFDELASAGWDPMALRRWLPPCLGIALDACTRDRHPQYPERMLFGSFFTRIAGLLEADGGARLFETWSKLFAHPESSCALSRNPASFAKSKYGTKAMDNARECFDKGCFFECAFAIRNDVCPMADCESGGEDRRAALVASELERRRSTDACERRDVEDLIRSVVTEPIPSDAPTNLAPNIRCLEYLRKCVGVPTPRKIAVHSPSWFYHAAKGAKV